MFDYIYYRLYKVYKEKEHDTIGYAAAIAFSLIQLLIAFSIFIMLDMIFPRVLSDWLSEIIGKIGTVVVAIPLTVTLLLFNFFYYKKNRQKVIDKYRNHPANKWFRPWMLYPIMLIIIFVLPVLCWQVLRLIR
jgi:uncharacterized membrane protein